MADDPLGQVLRLVAEGRLTAEEAAPILDALDPAGHAAPPPSHEAEAATASRGGQAGGPRFARIQVLEGGRRSVDLRVPVALGRRALSMVPGLGDLDPAGLEAALARGAMGPLLDITDAHGDGVRIVLE